MILYYIDMLQTSEGWPSLLAVLRLSQLQEISSEISRPDGVPTTLSIGIHSGPLVAGEYSNFCQGALQIK